jgi:putative colanic acid biosynthesis UDP-glucose lipid carrier transferase
MDKLAPSAAPISFSGSGQHSRLKSLLKKSRHISKKMLSDLMIGLDTSLILLAAYFARHLYSILNEQKLSDPFDYIAFAAFIALGFHIIARHRGLYEFKNLTHFSDQLSSVIYIWTMTCGIAFMAIFFLKIAERFSRLWYLEWSLIVVILLALGRGLVIHFFEKMARSGDLRRSMALIGAGRQLEAVRDRITADSRHFALCTILDLAQGSLDATEAERAIREFAQKAQAYEADDIMIALPHGHGMLTNLILQHVQSLPADIHVAPDFDGVHFSTMRWEQAGDLPYVTTVLKPIAGWAALLKRAEDLILASLLFVTALPAIALIALAIKLDSKGPVLFRQRRNGYNHRVIEVLKFRTMTVLEDGDTIVQATRNDARVTAVGRFLRRTSLDELPQLVNVLRGEMSLVGPRPHALAHNTHYGDLVEHYANRHRVKPGITGWAQVHGFRGETKNPQTMAQRIRYDLEYIDNWSIWLDVKILVMTPFFGIFRKSAY